MERKLRALPWEGYTSASAGVVERRCIEVQLAAEVVVLTDVPVGKDRTLETTGADHSTKDGEAEYSLRWLAHLEKIAAEPRKQPKERLKFSRRERRDIGEKRWNNYYCLRTTWKTGGALL